MSNTAIAEELGCHIDTARKWRKRFAQAPALESLEDEARSGRPPQIPVEARCQLVRLACERPTEEHVPFRDVWTYQSLATALFKSTGYQISTSEVGRILRFQDIRPHRVRQWLHSRDPDFYDKARHICELYRQGCAGQKRVICVDEKPMQALERKYPTTRAPDGSVRREYEYVRHGTRQLLAGFDVSDGSVIAEVFARRDAKSLVEFMEKLAVLYPDGEVHIIWDNLNIHYDGPSKRWREFNRRHGERFKFHYTPLHASWMNQIEIWFSILHRRILKYGSFESQDALEERVRAYVEYWNIVEKHPFRWTWRTDRASGVRKREDAESEAVK